MLLIKKEQIELWLNQYDIDNYELVEDQEYGYVVNVNNTVDFFNMELLDIEIKFNEINGDFCCSNNYLDFLKGCPEIVRGNFDCSHNDLKSLLLS